MKFNLFTFLIACGLGAIYKKLLSILMSQRFILKFLSKSFKVLVLKCKSMIHIELILCIM